MGGAGFSVGGEAGVSAVVPGKVTFSRRELDRILGLYGRMVAAGEWRDYAIDFLKDRALLSYYVADEKTGRISSRFRSLPVSWFYQGDK